MPVARFLQTASNVIDIGRSNNVVVFLKLDPLDLHEFFLLCFPNYSIILILVNW